MCCYFSLHLIAPLQSPNELFESKPSKILLAAPTNILYFKICTQWNPRGCKYSSWSRFHFSKCVGWIKRNLFCDAFWKRGKTPEGKCNDSFNTFHGMRIGVMTFMETSWRTFECMARTCRVVWRLYLWPHNFGFLELELGPIKGCAIQIWVWARLKRTSRFQDLRGCGISIERYCSIQRSFTEHLWFMRHWGYKHVTLSLNSSGQSLGEGRTGGPVQFSRCYGGGRYRVLWEKRGHIT